MNEITTNYNADNPYLNYGKAAGGITGTFLKFDKGSYYAGKDSKLIQLGTKMIANFPEFQVGWKCWKEGKLVDDRMMLLADGVAPPKRSELPDLDNELWERDKEGELKDPWQFGNSLPLFEPKSNEQYIFGTQSKSGIRSLAQTCGLYGREHRQRAGLLPLVELQGDSWQSNDYGRIPFPKLNIVDWVAMPGVAQAELKLVPTTTKF